MKLLKGTICVVSAAILLVGVIAIATPAQMAIVTPAETAIETPAQTDGPDPTVMEACSLSGPECPPGCGGPGNPCWAFDCGEDCTWTWCFGCPSQTCGNAACM